MASMAASLASKLAKLMKAKPFEFPVSGSLMIFGVCRITPNALKISYSSFSSISGSRFPMKTLAPTSRFLVLEAAWRGEKGIDRGREGGREGVGGGGRGEGVRGREGRRKRGGKGKREGGRDGGGRRENGRE